ncbi:hypothetical protein KMW28_27020 [Flammeovirga yaeyamensis]|uniref:Uncharacterized protein n=1 Tax=Flammeovirga yaeyamensis TaxID=367791 RepID=A0AAX1NE51_9BACT|nr:hypothetical protein [Flammeovirga yaeyamensis]MBB3700071.1 hypothetical protein [Flammeovirga yaeyamensis]NMF37495.1 hypothetical protein [Flammeovirga yaeyamensis]QWG04552.1 hypothetical protein KMW28_27020 [Flammeovirga yaeyamensis]
MQKKRRQDVLINSDEALDQMSDDDLKALDKRNKLVSFGSFSNHFLKRLRQRCDKNMTRKQLEMQLLDENFRTKILSQLIPENINDNGQYEIKVGKRQVWVVGKDGSAITCWRSDEKQIVDTYNKFKFNYSMSKSDMISANEDLIDKLIDADVKVKRSKEKLIEAKNELLLTNSSLFASRNSKLEVEQQLSNTRQQLNELKSVWFVKLYLKLKSLWTANS